MLNAEVLSRAAAPQRGPDVEGEVEEEEDEEVDEQTVSWGRFAYSISLIGLALGAVVLVRAIVGSLCSRDKCIRTFIMCSSVPAMHVL